MKKLLMIGTIVLSSSVSGIDLPPDGNALGEVISYKECTYKHNGDTYYLYNVAPLLSCQSEDEIPKPAVVPPQKIHAGCIFTVEEVVYTHDEP